MNAAVAWARDGPLEHNRRTAQPAVSVEEVQPDIEAAEVAAVHVTLWVTSPYFEAEVVDLEIGFPTTVGRLGEALKDSCSVMPDYATDFICTTPQLGRDFASFVAIPPWVRETSKTGSCYRQHCHWRSLAVAPLPLMSMMTSRRRMY